MQMEDKSAGGKIEEKMRRRKYEDNLYAFFFLLHDMLSS
jgi:hypothetical protein